MTTELPAEVVEVAAASLCDWDQQYTWGSLGAESPMKASYEEAARDALTAAAPLIRAQALEYAADAMEADTTFRDPLRLRADWLRTRAKQERGEG